MPSRPPNLVEHTWLAYALRRPEPTEGIEGRLARVQAHYQELMAQPLVRGAQLGSNLGLVLWRVDSPTLTWPLWNEATATQPASAWTSAPTGWERVLGSSEPQEASGLLAARLREDPERLVEVNPPFVLGSLDRDCRALEIRSDFIGIARLYELETEAGWVWSNRIGALPLFDGSAPEPDERAWQVFAAAGWFLGATTSVRGVRKLPGASIVSASAPDRDLRVLHSRATARSALIAPRQESFDDAVEQAAEQAVGLARDVGRLWPQGATVDLSGGRDSRVSAAAALAADLPARFQTVNLEPGEIAAAESLVETAGRPMAHELLDPEPDSVAQDLWQRLSFFHHTHDGMANPQAGLRGGVWPLHPGFDAPVISGHGGELGHGFYYRAPEHLRRLEGKGAGRMAKRLERMARKGGSAAVEGAYVAYMEAVAATIDEGTSLGLEGPNLLDYFYLTQRLAHRSGLGARNDRYSTCSTPAFVRLCFDLTPQWRLQVRAHRAVIARLAPQWGDVPFYSGGGTDGTIEYSRIWEREADADRLERMIEDDDSWHSDFRAGRVKELWADARSGQGTAHHERAFLRIAWRVSFDEHLRMLARRATGR
jgi:hypothetical protein